MSILLYAFAVILSVSGVSVSTDTLSNISSSGDYFASVEIDIAETSPKGDAGGYAIPASGCSAAHPDGTIHDCILLPSCSLSGASSVQQGSNLTLSWSTDAATSGSINQGVGAASPIASGSKTFYVSAAPGTLTFTMTVSNSQSGNSASCTKSVTVTAPSTNPATSTNPTTPAPTCTLAISPNSLPAGGGSITLSWASTNASSASLSNVGSVATTGSHSRNQTVSQNYVLTVTGAGGTASCSKQVYVASTPQPVNAPTCTINASPNSLPAGGGTTNLSWSGSGATDATLSGVGSVPVNSSQSFSQTASRTYTLTVSNSSTGLSGSCSRTVSVASGEPTVPQNPPKALLQVRNMTTNGSWVPVFYGSPGSIPSNSSGYLAIGEGDQIELKWSSYNANQCFASGGDWTVVPNGATSGTTSNVQEPTVSPYAWLGIPSTKNYWVTCTGAGGTAASGVTVEVDGAGGSGVDLKVRNQTTGGAYTDGPLTINPGDQINLQWTSTNMYSCTGTNFTAGSTNGTQLNVTEPGEGHSQTYTISCSGFSGNGADQTVVISTRPGSGVDLRSENLQLNSGSLEEDSVVNFRATVRNVGSQSTATQDDQFTDEFRYCWGSSCNVGSGTVLSRPNKGVLAAGASSADTSSNLTLSSTGVLKVQHCVDWNDEITETTETYEDNCEVTTFNVDEGEGGPQVSLYVQNTTTGSEWLESSLTITAGEQIALRWESVNATSCTGSYFSTGSGSPANGTQNTVTEPTAGSGIAYLVSCTDGRDTAFDTVAVDAEAASAPPDLEGNPEYVHVGEDTDLTWNTNGASPSSCTLVGPGVNLSSLGSATGSMDVTIYGESTFTLTCPSGSDTETIKVLPVVQET